MVSPFLFDIYMDLFIEDFLTKAGLKKLPEEFESKDLTIDSTIISAYADDFVFVSHVERVAPAIDDLRNVGKAYNFEIKASKSGALTMG
jgi:hypothetical protein